MARLRVHLPLLGLLGVFACSDAEPPAGTPPVAGAAGASAGKGGNASGGYAGGAAGRAMSGEAGSLAGAATGDGGSGLVAGGGGTPAGGMGASGAGRGGTGGRSGGGAGRGPNQGGAAGMGVAGAGTAGSATSGSGGVAASAGAGGKGGALGVGGESASTDCPPGITQTITVAKSGAMFTTVQAAVDSLASGSSSHVRVEIAAGTYREKLIIASRSNLCLVGAGADATVLTYDDSNSKVGSTSGSASVLVSADDFSANKLTIENSFGAGSQAVALRTTGKRQQFKDCRFVGHQDTLYTHEGTQYFRDCYVQGNTDYVFGGATAVLENCEVKNVEGGSAVAAPNTDSSVAYGIVFLGGSFTAAASVKANSVGLGRPWGEKGAAAYLHVSLASHIASAGFVEMSGNQPENARFHEYQSTGPGANASAHPGYELDSADAANYTVAKVLAGWTPSYAP
jgi:pectin methylesterase-like acyl-CoA thioesterase